MGASASTELKTAEASMRKLQTELRAAQTLAARKDVLLTRTTAELEIAEAAKISASSSANSRAEQLEKALRATRADAEVERIKYREVLEELKKARDDLEKSTGELKFKALEKGSTRKQQQELLGDKNREATKLVVQANETLLQEEKLNAEEEDHLLSSTTTTDHGTFGKLLHDFGHKRIYMADPRQLWTGTLLWERQRAFRDDRASMIAKAKAASVVGGWPGTIVVVERPEVSVVVDGQHRLGAAWILGEGKMHERMDLDKIVVEVYPSSTKDSEIFDLFAEINKCEPVALVDMPGEMVEGGATEDEREAIDNAAKALKTKYPAMFKPSRECQIPHVNVDRLRDEIHKSGVLRNQALKGTSLLDWMMARNDELSKLPQDAWRTSKFRYAATKTKRETALAKAAANKFFLGLTWDWLNIDDSAS